MSLLSIKREWNVISTAIKGVCAQQNSITEPDVKYKWKGEITEVPKGMEGRLEDKKEVVSRNLNINNREK